MKQRYAVFISLVVFGATLVYAAEQTVGQKGRLFSPGTVRLKAGDSLQFKNDDTVTHHVYSLTKGQEFDLATAKPGTVAKRTFAKPGRVEIRCGLHPGMRLVVMVE